VLKNKPIFDTIRQKKTKVTTRLKMKKLGLMVLLALGLASCSTSGYHQISPEKAKSMMNEGNVVIIDVRTLDEYNDGHILGALLIPNESIGSTQPSLLPDKDAVILVYCRSGNRSKQASDKLVAMGYTKIYDFGGIIDWPYEVVN
jgi:rhodanese-related sulfurtransferase